MSLTPDESLVDPRRESGDAGWRDQSLGLPDGKLDGAAIAAGEGEASGDRMLQYLMEVRGEESPTAQFANGSAFRKFRVLGEVHEAGLPSPPNRAPSSSGSYSTPDDTPSVLGSVTSSSFAGSAFGSRFSPSPSLRPFDRRFQSRLQPSSPSSSQILSPRALSPSLLGVHSRRSSIGSKLEDVGAMGQDDRSAPWEVVRWTKLKKITNQIFSDPGRRSFGTPTCIAVSATIALGTTKGIVLVFDYSQNLKSIIGPGTKAVECGPITALAVSADHTTIAGGHTNGHIFTWELAKPSRPFLKIPPLASYQMGDRKEDGHVEGVSILHLGFLGTRHTALVSADDRGMAFSHLATRGLGAVGRTVKTARILGRYPVDIAPTGRPRKPSSVLALSVLPLGNSPERTDSMGLVAMLTPYLLVIVSTTPIAQTQHKAVRPKEIANDSALSGCLAWYPAVKLKTPTSNSRPASSKARLAYAWSNVLTLLELNTVEGEGHQDPNRPPALEFKARSRYRCEEAIVAVQWFSRQIIGVLTISQRLIILEDVSLRVTETFDLMPKRIIHKDIFANHLHPLVNQMDEEGSIHHHVADAFYNSFRTYKGRVFLLCSQEISVGALSNWADRLLAMMEVGDFIGAIHLATTYYVGKSNKLTIGLPEDPDLRHPMVEEKLLEMISASLRYAFGKNQSSPRKEMLGNEKLQELAAACFDACLSTKRTDFLFDEAFEHFEQGGSAGIFLETLEPHILEEQISFIPPIVVKALILHFTSLEQEGRLEEMICHMDTRTLDIDQVTTLCKQHQLYDAMIYVWNRALGDYITPMIDLLTLLVPLIQGMLENGDSMHAVNALKLFPYLSYTLTGRVYPTGEALSEPEASGAKAQIYYFLFLGQTVTWPKQGGKAFLTKRNVAHEPSFPYLRLILQFDAASFLSALNEAFEDSFLNGTVSTSLNGNGKQDAGEEQVFGRSVNRQYVVSILLEVMNPSDFPPQDTIYLDMFIARNLPKFPQFIILSGTQLHRVLVGLCNPPGEDIADDCQLSVEYLLTVYRPPNIDGLVELFLNAGFFRVLKSIFRSEKQYAKLLRTHFDDEEALEAVFDCISDCLRPRSGLTEKERREVKGVIEQNAKKLIRIGEIRTARIINSYAPDLHGAMLAAIEDNAEDQFSYLRAVLEPSNGQERPDMNHRPAIMQNTGFVETYVRLMCEFDPEHVSQYVSALQSGDLRLEKVLPAMESSGVMDAAVVLMAREGQIRQAMDRLLSHLGTLEAAYVAVVKTSVSADNVEASNKAATETLESLQKYAQVGVWLCQGQMKSGKLLLQQRPQNLKRRLDKDPLNTEELLWLDLVDMVVRIAKHCISLTNRPKPYAAVAAVPVDSEPQQQQQIDSAKLLAQLRQFVQDTFSALLAATLSTSHHVSFLHILRAFLVRASIASPSLAHLRSVLADIFEEYLYESHLLSLATRLLDKDLFIHVDEAAKLRQRGWRPASQSCEQCGKRLWGAGAAGGIYSAWEKTRLKNQRQLEVLREERRLEADGTVSAVARGKSKARVVEQQGKQDGAAAGEGGDREDVGEQLVLFCCRHGFHRQCLEGLRKRVEEEGGEGEFVCAVCWREPKTGGDDGV